MTYCYALCWFECFYHGSYILRCNLETLKEVAFLTHVTVIINQCYITTTVNNYCEYLMTVLIRGVCGQKALSGLGWEKMFQFRENCNMEGLGGGLLQEVFLQQV